MSKNKSMKPALIIIGIILFFNFVPSIFMGVLDLFGDGITYIFEKSEEAKDKKEFKIISSVSNEFMGDRLYEFARENKIDLTIEYYGDLEIVDILNSNENDYDAVWISNSIWLYMLDNTSLVTDSKSIAINPVVMAVTKSKAESLGFTSDTVRNVDILNAIKEGKLNYVMPSVTKTNTGATAYLGFLNSLAGSPEVLSSEILKDESLIQNMKSFFTGVERVSGDEAYLESIYLYGGYDAIINYESSLISLNKQLTEEGKETLYLIYPEDGVAINDMPFGYVDRGQDKKENFEKILKYLRSEETAETLESYGLRTWYGGTNKDADSTSFKKEWGIDTTEYLIPLKYPGKKVITEALDLYIEQLRKPTHTVFCLDVSGSMATGGLDELKDAMRYILDKEEASKDRLQFSSYDKISIIAFTSQVQSKSNTYNGDETEALISYVNKLNAYGGTNIYDPSVEALKILSATGDEYTKTVILMTDGESNTGSFSALSYYYNQNGNDIPIYSITFGDAKEYELEDIAELTNAKIFDGKDGLKEAFKEVRSYN